MKPVYTSNDSEFTRLEGLYVKERNPPAQIAGVFLGVVGLIGVAVRGPATPVEIGSEARFLEVYGGRDYGSGGTLINQMWLSLLNKQFGTVVCCRAIASDAVAASFTFEDLYGGTTGTAIIRVDATSKGLWGNDVSILIQDASDGDADHFNLTAKYLGKTQTYKNLDTSATGNDNLAETLGDDEGNWIVITKLADGRPANTIPSTNGADADGYVNLGETVSGFTSVAGTDGSIADSDFTVTDGPLDQICAYAGIGVVMVAERMSSTLKTALNTKAGAAYDRLFLIGPDSAATTKSSAISEVASYRSDRLIYCFNHPYTLDPETATQVQVRPESWMASILSQTDVDIHPGDEDNKKYTAGISKLTWTTLTREDYIAFKAAGICALESDDGFGFVSGVTTSLTPGKEEITRRRMTDYLQISIANTLKYSVKKKNTESRRAANGGMVSAFLKDLKRNERIVEDYEVDTEKLNTEAQRALGIEKMLIRVKLISHALYLVLETEIGTGVSVTEAA